MVAVHVGVVILYTIGMKSFQSYRNRLKILDAISLTSIKFHTESPKMLAATNKI